MFVYFFVCLLTCFFILIIVGHPQEYTLKISWRSDLIWLRYIGFLKMFICLFVSLIVDLFVFILIILEHPQEYTLKILWRSDLICLRYIGFFKNVYLFVCLLTGFFYFNHLETPTWIYPENFVKIPLDLAEILRIRKLDWKMFICLFVCLFVYIFVCFLL